MSDYQEIAVKIKREGQEAASECLLELGAQGVAIEDSLLVEEASQNNWGDYFPSDLANDDTIIIKAYFSQPKKEQELTALKKKLLNLANYDLDVGEVTITQNLVYERDWANAWKQYYNIEKIGSVVIQPSWKQYLPKEQEIIIQLDPGMAFGTGTHPTTANCIKLLQELDVQNRVVWDIGTGSGILAILASKLNANTVKAIDIDKVAVQVAKENAHINNVEVAINVGTISELIGKADLIIANIIADVIIIILPQVVDKLIANGKFIASGIIEQKAKEVATKAKSLGLQLIAEERSGEWVTYCFAKKGC